MEGEGEEEFRRRSQTASNALRIVLTHHLARTDRIFHASEIGIGLALHDWSRLKKPWQVPRPSFLPSFLLCLSSISTYCRSPLSLSLSHHLCHLFHLTNLKVRAGAPFGAPERLSPWSLAHYGPRFCIAARKQAPSPILRELQALQNQMYAA